MHSGFLIIFPIFFIVILGLIVAIFIKIIRQWSYNNKQPVLSVQAKVVSKRSHVSHNTHNHNNHHHHSTSTSYYVTFQVESGDRMEFHVPAQEYGFMVEGDEGKLTFQGTRFHSFARN